MSVYVIDNGGHYSDHEIAFVEEPKGPEAAALMDLLLRLGSFHGWLLLGIVAEADWKVTPLTMGELLGIFGWRLGFYQLPYNISREDRRALLEDFRHSWLTVPVPESFPSDLEDELDNPDHYLED